MDPLKKTLLRCQIDDLAQLARRHHYYCDEDHWYNCPAHPEGCADDRQPAGVCNCGAEQHNAAVEKLKALIETTLL